MSDNWLQYIPTDPYFKPTAHSATVAEKLLDSFVPLAETVRSEFNNSISFYHPGGNWSGVKCPSCGADAESWFNNFIDQLFENNFSSLVVKAPCCGATVSLNELNYLWPAGFASFAIEAMNPNVKALTSQQLSQLAQVLGCSLREIAVHL